ncbi:hypothetical protein [Allosphingosinicella flava]|nr:hypothetical protein [Sphingosinicella flava]
MARQIGKGISYWLLALVLGCLLASVLVGLKGVIMHQDPIYPLIFAGWAVTILMFGTLPALVIGVPAIIFLRKCGIDRLPAIFALLLGGAVIGGLLMAVTFEGFEFLAATSGGCIGFMLGLLFFPKSKLKAGNV